MLAAWIGLGLLTQGLAVLIFRLAWPPLYRRMVARQWRPIDLGMPPKDYGLSAWTGVVERLLFAGAVAFSAPAIPTLVIAWVGVKTAVGWREIWSGSAYGRARGTVGLWGTALSLIIAIFSGFVWRHALTLTSPAIRDFFALP